MKKFLIKPAYILIAIFITLTLSISFQSLYAAWNPPSANPPSGNTETPVYKKSTADQTMTGGGDLRIIGAGFMSDTVISTNALTASGWISEDGDNEGININGSGNVGIGISNPGYRLDVNGVGQFQGLRTTDNNSTRFFLGRYSAAAPYSYIAPSAGSSGIKINDAAVTAELLTIQNNGNVGIGIGNPSQTLDVNGKIRMGTQTAAGDANDIVATKKYVDDKAGGSGSKMFHGTQDGGLSVPIDPLYRNPIILNANFTGGKPALFLASVYITVPGGTRTTELQIVDTDTGITVNPAGSHYALTTTTAGSAIITTHAALPSTPVGAKHYEIRLKTNGASVTLNNSEFTIIEY